MTKDRTLDDVAGDIADETLGDQLEQTDSGRPQDYPYGGSSFHYYWGILNGGWVVMQRKADAGHPANSLPYVRMHPPDGVEPLEAERSD